MINGSSRKVLSDKEFYSDSEGIYIWIKSLFNNNELCLMFTNVGRNKKLPTSYAWKGNDSLWKILDFS